MSFRTHEYGGETPLPGSRFGFYGVRDPGTVIGQPSLGGLNMHPHNLAARAGRWSAQHRKLAISGWLGLVFAVFALGSAAKTVTQEHANSGVGESGRASTALTAAFPKHVVEEVFVHSSSVNAARARGARAAATSGRAVLASGLTRARRVRGLPARGGRKGASAANRRGSACVARVAVCPGCRPQRMGSSPHSETAQHMRPFSV